MTVMTPRLQYRKKKRWLLGWHSMALQTARQGNYTRTSNETAGFLYYVMYRTYRAYCRYFLNSYNSFNNGLYDLYIYIYGLYMYNNNH